MLVVGIIGAIISAIGAGYSAYASSETSKAQAKQARYNAEADADAIEKRAEQERLNRDTQRRADARKLKRRRSLIEMGYVKSGVTMEGTPSAALSEQAAADEELMQNMERLSIMRGEGYDVAARNTLLRGRLASGAYRRSARTSLIAGALNTTASGLNSYSRWTYR